MKRNNQNIIFDTDITMTNKENLGKSLDSVLSSQESRISKIESNTKWLYKYGGMGSGGGGGGGGQSSSWKVVLTSVDTGGTILKDGDTINFSGKGEYSFKVQIYNGGTSQYKMNWTFKNSSGNQSISDIVSSTSSFTITKKFSFDINANLNLTIQNQDTFEITTFRINYIVVPYSFDMYFVYADDHSVFVPYENGNIFMSMVKERGIQIALDYQVNVGLQKSEYTYTNWEGISRTINLNDETLRPGEYPIYPNRSDVIYLDLVSTEDIISYLSNNDNAAYREFSINIKIRLEGRSEDEKIAALKAENNLIPANMYLKVKTSAGSIYQKEPTTYSKQFNIGVAVFNLTPYYGGLDKDRIYRLEVKYGETKETATVIPKEVINIDQLKDQTEQAVSIPVVDSGKHYIEFTITTEGVSYTCGYYIFVRNLADEFPWYPAENPTVIPTKSMFYRYNVGAKNITLNGVAVKKTDSFNMTVNSSKTKLNLYDPASSITDFQVQDQLVCVGIQYSSVNDTSEPIISFNTAAGKNSIYIFQDKVIKTNADDTVTGESKDIFIDKIDQMEISNPDKYHLIQIYKRFETSAEGSLYKSISIYIDGILEGVFNTFDTVHVDFTSITIYPGNYYINLMEYSCFEHMSNAVESQRSYLNDNDILGYFYSYTEKLFGITLDTSEKILYQQFSQFERTNENYMMCKDTEIANIAMQSKVPVLLMKFTDNDGYINPQFSGYNKDNFKEWMEKTYTENDIIETLNVTLKWASGNGEELHDITYNNNIATFQTTIQGSSTRGYRCKNFDLIAPASDESDYLYTPNFNLNDTASFLPESVFTLKADVVDSSHSNNNTMGNFINKITTRFKSASQSGNIYSGHIKNCLTGFPVLLFLHTSFKESETSGLNRNNYYFLGIFNFNLGRKSYFNLGYKNLDLLNNLDIHDGFGIYKIDGEKNKLLNGIRVAEVQGNSNYFDFSQSDSTILFPLPGFEKEDTTYMFGDLIDGTSSDGVNTKNALLSAVQAISLGGGHIFEKLEKTFSTNITNNYGYDEGYSAVNSSGEPKNQVPNYKFIATREKDGTSNIYTFSPNPKTATEGSLKDLILGDIETGVSPILDYTSLVEYYTTCMAFGLVDSVQKNLNIKSWNSGKTFYTAFYDMDTCLGIANDGSKINYYAFSDYWKSSNSGETLNMVKVYRDFAPSDAEEKGSLYDIPSSYLFAVAKYAHKIIKSDDLEMHPNNVWGKWRMQASKGSDIQTGCLENADDFINKYYAGHLKNISVAAFNANYRYKYLVFTDDRKSYDTQKNFKMFWGRKIAYTRNWLNNRLHILDAYFNINGISDAITKTIAAPSTDSKYIDNDNQDIYVLHDIFSTDAMGNQYGNMTQQVSIKALPSSPIILKSSNSAERYLTLPNYSSQQLWLKTSGMQYLLIGGSSLWTYVNTIVPFITRSNTLRVKSSYFTSILGASGKCSGWSTEVPAIREVSLTSEDYSGQLKFNETNPNLQSVNISNTAIELEINNSTLNTITAKNMKDGSKLMVTNTYTLKNMEINGSMTSLTIPAWKKDIYLPTNFQKDGSKAQLNCQSITITNDTATYPGNTLYLRNNSKLTTLNVTGFETIDITGCPNLKKIYIGDTNVLKKISVAFSSVPENEFTIGNEENVIDLSTQTKLNSIYFAYCSSIEIRVGSNAKVLMPNNTFYGCKNLKYLTTLNNAQLLIHGSGVFYGCGQLTLKNPSGQRPNLYLSSSVTNIANTFYVPNGGVLTIDDAIWFLNTCCNYRNNITSIENIFRGQQIIYLLTTTTAYEYCLGKCQIDLNFPNATSAAGAFYGTSVRFMNRYMFKNFGRNKTTLDISSIFSTGVVATVDFLYEILDKIQSLNLAMDHENGAIEFYTITKNGTTASFSLATEIKIFDVFHQYDYTTFKFIKTPKKLTSIYGFGVKTSLVDLDSMFTDDSSDWVAAKANGITISGFAGNQLMNVKTGTMEYMFSNIRIKSITSSFRSVSYKDEDGKDILVDLKKFINWTLIDKAENLFYNGNAGYPSLCFRKCINSLEDFHYIWDKIIKTTSLRQLSYVFQNTMIKTGVYVDNEPLYLNSEEFRNNPANTPNTQIYDISYLFDGMYITTDNGNTKHSISLTSEFLKYLPSVTVFRKTFQGLYLHNTLPYNFFNKRYGSSPVAVWIDYPEVNPQTSEIEYVKKPGKLYKFDYHHTITDLYRCFYNTVCKENFEGFLSSASYNNQAIDDNYLTYYDPSDPILSNEVRADVDYYYTSRYSSVQTKLEHRPEITDCYIETDYTQSIQLTPEILPDSKGAGAKLQNYAIDTQDRKALNRLFVAPDIIYGMRDGATLLEEMFANDIDDTNTFVGALPKNMFKTSKGVSFKNMFKNLNILPQKYNSYQTKKTVEGQEIITNHDYYTFIPSGFTECSGLDEAFRFRIFMPPYKTNTLEVHYCIMLADSIPSSTVSLQYGLPYTGYKYLYQDTYNLGTSGYNFATHNIGLFFTLIDTPKYEEDEITHEMKFVGTDVGIDFTKFKSIQVDNLIQPSLIKLLYGHIFNQNSWTGTGLLSHISNSSKNYMIDLGVYGQFPMTLTDFFPINNNQFLRGSEIGGASVNNKSVKNYSEIIKSKYPGISFI